MCVNQTRFHKHFFQQDHPFPSTAGRHWKSLYHFLNSEKFLPLACLKNSQNAVTDKWINEAASSGLPPGLQHKGQFIFRVMMQGKFKNRNLGFKTGNGMMYTIWIAIFQFSPHFILAELNPHFLNLGNIVLQNRNGV